MLEFSGVIMSLLAIVASGNAIWVFRAEQDVNWQILSGVLFVCSFILLGWFVSGIIAP